MIQSTRRGLLTALLFAPVIVKASSLMAIKPPLERRYDVEPGDGIGLNFMEHPVWKRADIYGTDLQGRPIYQAMWIPERVGTLMWPLSPPPNFKVVTSIKVTA